MNFFNFLTGKNNNTTIQKQLQKSLTANEFINVKDIEGNIVYTKDNKLYAYIKIKPFSLELLSEEEQRRMGRRFTAEFSAIKRAYKFFSISRPVDVSFMLDNLNKIYTRTQHIKRKELIRNKMSEINQIAMSSEVLEHNFYMVLWVSNKKDAPKELLKLATEAISCFRTCQMEVTLCNEGDIKMLFNLFANPNYAHLENTDTEEYIPFVGVKD